MFSDFLDTGAFRVFSVPLRRPSISVYRLAETQGYIICIIFNKLKIYLFMLRI